jgi:ribosomal protein L3 glutamine methyltransferase
MNNFSSSNKPVQAQLSAVCTVRDMLHWGFTRFQQADLFYGHGTENAWDEIIYLVLAVLQLGPQYPQCLDNSLTLTERNLLEEKINHRILQRIPTAYLVNESWFAGLTFYVDSRVLIPRSAIAEVIEQGFGPWIAPEKVNAILDLGTGSGCIAIACAYAFRNAKIDAVDCSEAALQVAEINCAKHKCKDQVQLIQSNMFENLTGRRYEIIISNPPYVDHADFAQLPAEYCHEPEIALAAGKEGLDFIIQLLARSHYFLQRDGLLVVEVGNSKSALIRRYPQIPFTWLEFERSDVEVFLLTQKQLLKHAKEI